MTTTKHTYPFGIIGNCSYMSYVDQHANVVWQCWPYFDSSFIFGSLISKTKGGEFSITPATRYRSRQYYLQNTNILVTHFETEDGEFRVIDFAPRFELYDRYHRPLMLFRKIELLKGCPLIRVKCQPMGDYGEVTGEAIIGSNSINYTKLEQPVRLTTSIAKTSILQSSAFALTQNHYLVLSWGLPLEAPLEHTFEDFYKRTLQYWKRWVRRTAIPSSYQEEVIRSALLLKLHQYEDTGAIIASGTTSLPEHPGFSRNWDYRYCWLRDSYFTLAALNSLGHFSEAEGYSHWMQNIVQNNQEEHYQPVYKIDGSHRIDERIIPLEGYLGHAPVRVGNDAYRQVQHDVYGQMILSLFPLYNDLRVADNHTIPPMELIHKVLDKMLIMMDRPDAGIWEYREKLQRHAESYLFHWAGAKSAVKIAQKYRDKKLYQKAMNIIDLAEKNIERCYDPQLQAYGMSQSNKKLNASEFLLVTMGYLRDKEKATKHVRALEAELKTADHLIYRYREHDDFGETHSTFLICGFWYAEALADIGEVEQAKEVFESLLTRSNSLGIFSEDICPENGSQWGNMAQTYSHVGLINTAFKIDRNKDRFIV